MYPYRAALDHIEGHVTISFVVQADGSVSDVAVVESQPKGVFDDPALSAIKLWRFEPAVKECRPVAQTAVQRMDFRLEY